MDDLGPQTSDDVGDAERDVRVRDLAVVRQSVNVDAVDPGRRSCGLVRADHLHAVASLQLSHSQLVNRVLDSADEGVEADDAVDQSHEAKGDRPPWGTEEDEVRKRPVRLGLADYSPIDEARCEDLPRGSTGSRRPVRRPLLHRGLDDGRLLSARLSGPPAQGRERLLLRDGCRRGRCWLSTVPSLPSGGRPRDSGLAWHRGDGATWPGVDRGGVLDRQGVEGLAGRLGVGSRHLRRLFEQHLGASPRAVARTRRLHEAKRLLDETRLPVREIAVAAGYGSVRRLNAAFRSNYGRTPSELRRFPAARSGQSSAPQAVRVELATRAPFDGAGLLAFLAARAIPGVEKVDGSRYLRTFRVRLATGEVRRGSLEVEVADEGLVGRVLSEDAKSLLVVVATPPSGL